MQRSAISSVRRIASSWPGKSSAISSGVLKKNWSVSNFQWFGFLSESPDWMQSSASCALRVLVPQVVDVAGRDERQPGLGRELRQERVDPRLDVEARVLDLDVGRVAPEDLREPVEVGARVVGPALLERLADAAREAAGERDEPVRVPLEQLPVDPRLVVVALEVAGRRELDQVRVARRSFSASSVRCA